MTTDSFLDREAFEAWHTAIFGGQPVADGALLVLSGQDGHPDKTRRGSGHPDGDRARDFRVMRNGVQSVADIDRLWAAIEWDASRDSLLGRNQYSNVGLLAPGSQVSGRGRKEDVTHLPALVADIDVQAAVHAKGDENPPIEVAYEWVAEMPIRPTLVVHTGGGLHVYLRIDGMIAADTAECAATMAAWKAWWVNLAERTGWSIDKSVLASVTQPMRIPGTRNPNQHPRIPGQKAPLVRIVPDLSSLAGASAADVRTAFRVDAPAQPAPQRAVGTGPRPAASGDTPGTRLSRAVRADTLIEVVRRGRRIGRDGLVIPHPATGQYASDASIQIREDEDGITRVTIYGARVRDEWGVERLTGDGYGSLSAFDLLTLWLTPLDADPDYRTAAKVAAAFDGHFEDLLAILATAPVGALPADLAHLRARPRKQSVETVHVVSVTAPPATTTVMDVALTPERTSDIHAVKPPRRRAGRASIFDVPITQEVA